MRIIRVLVPLLAVALVGGCVTKYVVLNEVGRDAVPVTVITNDVYSAGQLLGRIEELGYDNDDNEVVQDDDAGDRIRWGGAPGFYVEEIARLVEARFDTKLARVRNLGAGNLEVIVECYVEDPEVPGREEFEVTVFADDEEKGEAVLAGLLALGYTNDANHVSDSPNDDFNIKWGAAPESYIDEIVDAIEEDGFELDRQRAFDYDDHDIFINLPYRMLVPPERPDFEVTVFCDDDSVGNEVLALLAGLGYTNEDSEVLAGPNEDRNIKYGALRADLLAEIKAALEERFAAEFEPMDIFDPNDRDVFINIPLPSPGRD